jgi:uncharacterized lipoprotein YmbA
MRRRRAVTFVLASLVASCASPPLTLYTLGGPADTIDTAPLGGRAIVIEVRRVAVPDNLDSQDIVVRNGSTLVRSTQGRWASRVSLDVTSTLTARLAQRRPDALVTDQPQIEPPNDRIFVTISTLDVTAGGTATLEADWLIVPRNPAQPTQRQRGRFTASGPVVTDQDVVALYTAVVRQLADAIDVASLR